MGEFLNKLHRSSDNMIFGVCDGIAKAGNWTPWVVRFIAVLLAITSDGFVILLYIILAIVLPEEHEL